MGKLALGTVQFGTGYGITNTGGQVPEHEVRAILARAAAAKVEVLDTAAAYGEAEQVLGRCLAGVGAAGAVTAKARFRLVSKTVPVRSATVDGAALDMVAAGLDRSRQLLGRYCIDAMLVHHADDLLASGGDRLWKLLQARQAEGEIGKIGVSVYDGGQLQALLARFPLQIVQLPLNVLDQRLLQSGWLDRLHRLGIEIHVRSAFLQGVLLAGQEAIPDRIGVVKAGVAAFQHACQSAGIAPAVACLGFLKALPQVQHVVCGVLGVGQLDELAAAWASPCAFGAPEFASFALADHPFLSPANWPQAV